jgi:ArsR family transcriptional regulator
MFFNIFDKSYFQALFAMSQKIRVLFLCVANAARSQLAEALLRHTDGEHYEAFSAGTQPSEVDPRARQALEQLSVSTEGLHSKPLESFDGQQFDYVITLCDKAAFECRTLPGAGEYIAWDFEDPASSQQPNAYKTTLQQIHERIKMFVLVKNKAAAPAQMLVPVTLFKCLADDTRARMTQLIAQEGELCVCELTVALEQIQPKISRHLALLRSSGLLQDRRAGQWVYYRLHPQLPAWVGEILTQVLKADDPQLAADRLRLHSMRDRPERTSLCG